MFWVLMAFWSFHLGHAKSERQIEKYSLTNINEIGIIKVLDNFAVGISNRISQDDLPESGIILYFQLHSIVIICLPVLFSIYFEYFFT